MIRSYWFAMPRTVVASQLVRPRTEITENTRPYASLPAAFQRARATILTNPAPNLIRFRSAIAFFAPVNKNLIFSPDRSPPPREEGRGVYPEISADRRRTIYESYSVSVLELASRPPPSPHSSSARRAREREREKQRKRKRERGSSDLNERRQVVVVVEMAKGGELKGGMDDRAAR